MQVMRKVESNHSSVVKYHITVFLMCVFFFPNRQYVMASIQFSFKASRLKGVSPKFPVIEIHETKFYYL